MDITFTCTNCNQELEVDSTAGGSTINCPSCGQKLVVPQTEATNIHQLSAVPAATPREERHFTVPVHDEPGEMLIEKPLPTLDESKDGNKRLRIRCIKRTDCVEVGKDKFEQVVGDFLANAGEENIVNILPISYTYIDMGTRMVLTDFGILIVYRR